MRSYREVCDMRVKARKSRRGEQQDTKNGLYSKKMTDTRLQPVLNCKLRKIDTKRNEEKPEKRKLKTEKDFQYLGAFLYAPNCNFLINISHCLAPSLLLVYLPWQVLTVGYSTHMPPLAYQIIWNCNGRLDSSQACSIGPCIANQKKSESYLPKHAHTHTHFVLGLQLRC